ncbi:hypothetical protein [Neglectibacter timonensis]|jgi:hypothetical protein|uniref:Uncharacterized protein n=1 Tax=Neglectibacter timonensis TaxID=1776382 RepID=A0ABT1S3S8_9FIRM|nr:hypothetical protein [Neglectibacter timonensis]MCQ4841598.1 hypothetical protein [Neglectibacter timonensis]MCQ4845272.1 hypothetical protein [Neglectibacter timonensis]
MAVNQKAIRALGKVLDAGFTDEKAISAMTMDDILSMQGITVTDIALINELQKSIKSNKVISFLGGGVE